MNGMLTKPVRSRCLPFSIAPIIVIFTLYRYVNMYIKIVQYEDFT
jgi:ABC-type polysaccharide transport system permease subunit